MNAQKQIKLIARARRVLAQTANKLNAAGFNTAPLDGFIKELGGTQKQLAANALDALRKQLESEAEVVTGEDGKPAVRRKRK